MRSYIDRRGFLASLPALMTVPRAVAQAPKPQIKVRGLNHVTLVVSDLKRSVDFYQDLFGLPVQNRQGSTSVGLRVGTEGHLGLSTGAVTANATPRIDHICFGIDDFDMDRIVQTLAAHGVTKSDQRGPMTVQIRMREASPGGAADGTPEVYVGDPDGIIMQLQHPSYCGGAGVLGNVCAAPEPTSKAGLIALKRYSHVTVFSTDPQRSNAFCRDVFGFGIRSYQGPTAPTLAVGPGVEFLMFTGGSTAGGAPAGAARRASINHFCFGLEGFDPDKIIKTLESYGIKPRESQTGPAGPMRHYITMRMANRGGAKEGTPELYFTDPDGILVQLQDVSYCGGSGVVGNVCPPV